MRRLTQRLGVIAHRPGGGAIPELRTGPDMNAYQALTFTARESPSLSAVLKLVGVKIRVSNARAPTDLSEKALILLGDPSGSAQIA